MAQEGFGSHRCIVASRKLISVRIFGPYHRNIPSVRRDTVKIWSSDRKEFRQILIHHATTIEEYRWLKK